MVDPPLLWRAAVFGANPNDLWASLARVNASVDFAALLFLLRHSNSSIAKTARVGGGFCGEEG